MAWKKADNLLNKRLNQHGLAGLVQAGLLCQEAERLYPQLFTAVSVQQKNGHTTLHIAVLKEKQLAFKLIEGKLLLELNRFADQQKLPIVTRIRLTIATESDIL